MMSLNVGVRMFCGELEWVSCLVFSPWVGAFYHLVSEFGWWREVLVVPGVNTWWTSVNLLHPRTAEELEDRRGD